MYLNLSRSEFPKLFDVANVHSQHPHEIIIIIIIIINEAFTYFSYYKNEVLKRIFTTLNVSFMTIIY